MTRVTEVVLSAFVIVAVIDADSATAQSSGVQSRTQAIVASFNKSKHAVKEKYGVRVEKYKEVRSEPAIRANVRDYAGSYEAEGMGLSFELKVNSSGSISVTGYEQVNDAIWRGFTLRNARIDGALLTATKVYADGTTEPFEGVFINRTSFDSPTARGVTTFGLGVIGRWREISQGMSVNRFFFERKR